jgi:PAS domain S-box-containing protein
MAIPDSQLFYDAFHASPIGIAVETLEGKPLFVNPALCSMLGFSEEELRNKHWVDFSPPEDAAKDWALFQKLRAGLINHYKVDKRYLRRDGSLVWGRLSISLLNCTSPLVVAMVEAITERERAEEELRQSEARLAAEVDALAKLDDWSSRLWQMSSQKEGLSEMLVAVIGLLGADKANVQLLDSKRGVLNIVAQCGFEQPFLDFFREVSAADQSACARSLRSGRQVVIEDIETDAASAPLRAIARASGFRAVTSTPLLSNQGAVLGVLSTHFKSPHRPSEESLLRLNLYARQAAGFVQHCTTKSLVSERYAAIVQSTDDAIISKNLDGIIVSWNPAAQHIFGYTADDAIGQPITILIPPELRDEENTILEKLRAGEHIKHYETIRVAKTGNRVNVSLTISPIKDSIGRIVGFSKIARDITEPKRREHALRNSEERLRLAQQAARIGTFEWNIQTGVNTWTPELEEMYGLPQGGFGGTQTAFENLIHPDDRGRIIELNSWALKTGQPTKGEWRVVWPDGSLHWISGRWQVFMNESGEPSRMIGVNGDVTERKLAEEALRESEQRIRLATQAGRMYAYDWDVKANSVMRSSEHVKILGLKKPLHFEQHQFVDRIHPDDRPKFLAAIAVLTPQNPTAEVTYRALAPDGTLVWLKSNGRGFFDAEGELLRVIGMVADVTDIKQAEEALRISEERLRLAQWAAHIGTFDLNLRTGVDIWQPETEALYGLPPGGFGGTQTAFEDLIHPSDRERVKELTREMVRTGQPAVAEWRVVWPDGSVHWIAGRGQVFKNESGEPVRVLGVNMDITERKRAEEALSAMTRKLIEAQEQERARIGRELHDDINQRLAMLAVELDQLQDDPSDLPRSPSEN